MKANRGSSARMNGEGHIGKQFFGCKLLLKDQNDNTITTPYTKGSLFLYYSLPGMLIDIIGNTQSINETYYSKSKEKLYYAGDEAYYDTNGNFWITGRNDDVLNVSGHRISPIEIEETIAKLDIIAEVAIVGYPHAIKGEGIYAFIVLKDNISENNRTNAKKIIDTHVRKTISPISKPDVVSIVRELPKTRSGKILKRVLSKIASCQIEDIEDLTTMNNPDSITKIVEDIKNSNI